MKESECYKNKKKTALMPKKTRLEKLQHQTKFYRIDSYSKENTGKKRKAVR